MAKLDAEYKRKRNRDIAVMTEAGRPRSEICRKYKISRARLYQILEEQTGYTHSQRIKSPQTLSEVYEFIIGYKKGHDGNSPSIREITDANFLGSTDRTWRILRNLRQMGLIRLSAERQTRSIEVIGGRWVEPPKEKP